ncbi:hypothetical protein [Streptomyces sp. NPDC047108]|uniref:hypothetical protein n=1 Tax=Streptomyces sp. NPDC047108 TaxID=3155025 RepID=UPI003409535F
MAHADNGTKAWADALLLHLVRRDMSGDAARKVVAEALARCAETGETPEQAFGEPRQYAEQIPGIGTDRRARADYLDRVSVDEYWGAPVTVPGYFMVLGGIVLWVSEGMWLTVTPAGLTGGALLCLAFVLAGCFFLLWADARPRVAAGAFLVAVGLGALVPLTGDHLSHTELGRVPSGLLIPLGLLLGWLGSRIKRPAWAAGGEPSRSSGPGRIRLVGDEPPVGAGDDRDGDDRAGAGTGTGKEGGFALDGGARRWLRRLEALLRIRHRVPRAGARQLVAEARAHLVATGTRPHDAFGDVEQYALRLVDDGRVARPSRKALEWNRQGFILAVLVFSLVLWRWEDGGFTRWPTVVLAVGWAAWLILHRRDKWPGRPQRRSGEKQG